MNLAGKTILVVGGAGFIGSHVVTELLKTQVARVVVYDNFSRGRREYLTESLRDPRCEIFRDGGDVRDVDLLDRAMQGVHGVVHLAAMWLLHCMEYPRTAFTVNVEGTFNVLEACVRNKVERLVFSSSASVYGDAVETPMSEEHPFNNRNFYGATKISGEAMCRAYHDRYGLGYVGLRYMNVYGPHQDQAGAYTGVIPTMLNKIAAGESPVVNGDGSQAYDFVYVRDVARSNVLALEADAVDEFYNVGTGKQTSIADLWTCVKAVTGTDLEVTYKPYAADDARQFVRNRIGSVGKARRELGFNAEYSLKDGLRHLLDWRRAG